MRMGTNGIDWVWDGVDLEGIACDVSSSKGEDGCGVEEGEIDRVNRVGTFNVSVLALYKRERNDGTEAVLLRSIKEPLTLGATDTKSSGELSIGMLPRLRILTMDSHCSKSDPISERLLVMSTTMTYTVCSMLMK